MSSGVNQLLPRCYFRGRGDLCVEMVNMEKFPVTLNLGFLEFTAEVANALRQAGCDDVLLECWERELLVRFDREAASREQAIANALASIGAANLTLQHDIHVCSLPRAHAAIDWQQPDICVIVSCPCGGGTFSPPYLCEFCGQTVRLDNRLHISDRGIHRSGRWTMPGAYVFANVQGRQPHNIKVRCACGHGFETKDGKWVTCPSCDTEYEVDRTVAVSLPFAAPSV
jgi:hypothetical protein